MTRMTLHEAEAVFMDESLHEPYANPIHYIKPKPYSWMSQEEVSHDKDDIT